MFYNIQNNLVKRPFGPYLCGTNLNNLFYLRNCTYWKLIKRDYESSLFLWLNGGFVVYHRLRCNLGGDLGFDWASMCKEFAEVDEFL